MAYPSHHADSLAPLERTAQRTVADEDQRALVATLERAGEAEHVLPLAEATEAHERRAVRVPAEPGACRLGVTGGEALEVDAAVDDLALAARLGKLRLEPAAEPLRDGDHGGRALDDMARRGAYPALRADVRDVLSVGRDDERRACRERGREARRHEEVGVRDIRIEATCATPSVAEQPHVASRAAAPLVHDRALDLVPARDELAFEVRHEDAEIRIVRPRIHLGDEEDSQVRYPRVTCRIPRHISSVVPSPHRT